MRVRDRFLGGNHAAVGEMQRPHLLDIDAVILDLALPQIAAHLLVVLRGQAMRETAT